MVKYHGPPSRVDMYQTNMRRRGIGVYFVKESQYLRSFFAMTARYVPEGSKVLEFGYGPGTLGIPAPRQTRTRCILIQQVAITQSRSRPRTTRWG